MKIIEPHIHMVSRTTDDYETMSRHGIVAITEPSFWAGYDRSGPEAFRSYFRHLTEWEPKRAAKFGIDYYCWMCLNPKEAEDAGLADEVIRMLPAFLEHPRCPGIGEIGLNRNSRNEIKALESQIDIAVRRKELVLVHTPHLEDKRKGTQLIVDCLKASGVYPDLVLIDHCEEHTISRRAGGR